MNICNCAFLVHACTCTTSTYLHAEPVAVPLEEPNVRERVSGSYIYPQFNENMVTSTEPVVEPVKGAYVPPHLRGKEGQQRKTVTLRKKI